jgi:hypothetical protein
MKKGVNRRMNKINSRSCFAIKANRLLKSKRSQATIFIIIAVLLVGTAAIAFFVIKNNSSDLSSEFSTDPDVQAKFNQVKTNIDDCMKFTSQEALDVIGFQGGYYKKPLEYYDLSWIFIPYYYKQGKLLMPTNSEIQKQLGLFVDENIKYCFDSLDTGDFKIFYSSFKTNVKINAEEVVFNIDAPIVIKRQDKSIKFELSGQPITLNSRLKEMLEVAKFITENHGADETVCLSCIENMVIERDLSIDMIDWQDSSTLFVISTNNTGSNPPDFEFLNKYKPVGNINDITI